MSSGRIYRNDILLVKDGATIGKVAIATDLPADEAAVNEHVFLLRVQPENVPKFYFYFVQSSLAQAQIQLEIRGSAQPGLNSEFRNVLVAPKPPRSVQQAIADYLDRETARIDALIAAKERLLALLAEKRRALITRAVTRGLDPNVPLRDSGIPWLGEIPAHWELKRLRFLILKNGGISTAAVEDVSALVTFLPMEAIGEQGELDLSMTRRLEEVLSGYSRFKDGDVVVAKITPCFENGKGALIRDTVTGIGFGTTELHVLSPKPELDSRFLYYITTETRFRRLGEAHMTGAAGQQRVPEDFIRDFRIAVPPLAVQRAIVEHIDRETAKLDAVRAAIERTIALLKERRSALIAAAVTGQLDVR